MRFKKFDLNLLVALDALLAERSVSRAALRLNLSPSATSDALARLREFFGDELLVQVGRRMEPTPRADSLQHAVRDMLVRLDSTITTEPSFDPARTDRRFRIYASDYTQMVLAPQAMRLAAAENCQASFDFLPQVAEPQRHLESGDADLLVLPRTLMSDDHPVESLYDESFVCVLWAGSQLAEFPLTRERYLAAGHVVMRPSASSQDTSFEDWFVRREGHLRRIAATSYGFATVPGLLVGTEWVATMHGRLASLLKEVWPLTLRACPVPIQPMTQAMQWHSYRTQDPGLEWLRQLLQRAAADLPLLPAIAT
jgi:LysR family transcriptional regulator, nod-box dependent transcriptional activator